MKVLLIIIINYKMNQHIFFIICNNIFNYDEITCAKARGTLPAVPLQGFCIKSMGEKAPTLDT